jgi:hypothetical protein
VAYGDIGAFEFAHPGESPAIQLPPPIRTLEEPAAAQAADGSPAAAPGAVALSNGFPNPSRAAVEFALDLPVESRVEWAVYDLRGRLVWSERREARAGRTVLRWSGETTGGEPAASGIYLVRAQAAGTRLTQRVVRL